MCYNTDRKTKHTQNSGCANGKTGRKEKTMFTSEMIKKINTTAQEDFEKAQAMLDGVNLVLGAKFGWLAKRVVRFENPDGSVAERYAHANDAYAEAKYYEEHGTI